MADGAKAAEVARFELIRAEAERARVTGSTLNYSYHRNLCRTIQNDQGQRVPDLTDAGLTASLRDKLAGIVRLEKPNPYDAKRPLYYLEDASAKGKVLRDDIETKRQGRDVPREIETLYIDPKKANKYLLDPTTNMPLMNGGLKIANGSYDPNYTGVPMDKYGHVINCKRELALEAEAHFVYSKLPGETLHHKLTWRDFDRVSCGEGWFELGNSYYQNPNTTDRKSGKPMRTLWGGVWPRRYGAYGGNTSQESLKKQHPVLTNIPIISKLISLCEDYGNDGVYHHHIWSRKIWNEMGEGDLRLLDERKVGFVENFVDSKIELADVRTLPQFLKNDAAWRRALRTDPAAENPNIGGTGNYEVEISHGVFTVQDIDPTLADNRYVKITRPREHVGMTVIFDIDKHRASVFNFITKEREVFSYFRERAAEDFGGYVQAKFLSRSSGSDIDGPTLSQRFWGKAHIRELMKGK